MSPLCWSLTKRIFFQPPVSTLRSRIGNWEKRFSPNAKVLVECGADVNARNDSGLTPLYPAVVSNKIEVVKVLVDYGADVNARNDKAWTPLHSAVLANKVEAVKFLVECGADVNASDNTNWI